MHEVAEIVANGVRAGRAQALTPAVSGDRSVRRRSRDTVATAAHAVLSRNPEVWMGRTTGEGWSVTAEWEQAVLALLSEKIMESTNDPERHSRIFGMAEQFDRSREGGRGFEVEYIGEKSYGDWMIYPAENVSGRPSASCARRLLHPMRVEQSR
ncbi:hypothetical protein OG921_12825 [Aldersonia sp. NBC_00410]|uniref:hypothetical protein n=1 Tax=Aldersonia sp. NBC_00410 TaxID=2975954 RepID=UPI00224DDEC5|nr:hypothetical protein [Aldersonia sp. NBC_00410]MCX5044050.1 hypothetical protein [Aldersonia sp. NBC_00410]